MSTQPRRPALRTLAETIRAGQFHDAEARKYFVDYLAPYHDWVAGQAEVTTDSDALIALAGAMVDNPEVRRAFREARGDLDRLVAVLDLAESKGQGLRMPRYPLQTFPDGSIGFDLTAGAGMPPAPPPMAPSAPPPAAPAAPSAAPAPAPAPPAAAKPAPTEKEVAQAGRSAHDAGELLTDCPYPGALGDVWESGWKAARQDRRRPAPAPPPPAPPPTKASPKRKRPGRNAKASAPAATSAEGGA